MAVKETHSEVYWRFSAFQRFMHLVMMVTFIGLALTGLPLKYPGAFWAKGLVAVWGGVNGAGFFHRVFAGATFGYFFLHLLFVLYYVVVLKGNLLGPNSMIPTPKDFKDLYQHILYFFGKGEAPKFGKFTYWEKFDYWAVFWGIGFIGLSGLLLWFPEFFSRFLPGIWFNIAYVIHSDEALLAIAFIFVVHLYNAHFRAGIFPMDKSIFTGKIDAREMMERHPLEWEDLNQNLEVKEKRRVRPELLVLAFVVFTGAFLTVASSGWALTEEERMEAEKKLCWKCHRLPNLNSSEGTLSSILLCMDCHGKKDTEKKVDGKKVSVSINEKEYSQTVHRRVACVRCHEGIAGNPHRTTVFECAPCHGYHGERTANDPHRSVTCEACHHESRDVMKDPKTGRIVLMGVKDGVPIRMTSHRFADFKREKDCKKCHFVGNALGAPVRVLPAKSVICIGCHSATISASDPLSIVAILLFLLGIALAVFFWFQGTVGDRSFSTHEKAAYLGERLWQVVFSRKILTLLKVFVVDVLFLRRILKESVSRWTVHSFIYLGIFLRFLIGLILLVLSALFPGSAAVANLLDKNYGPVAFLFDFLALCIIIGIVGAVVRHSTNRAQRTVTSGQDVLVLAIIGGLLVTGLLLEGMRILETGIRVSVALPSFLGYPISVLLDQFLVRWDLVYPYGWYVHAVLTAALVAYLPFSKMFHILVTPLVVALKAVSKES